MRFERVIRERDVAVFDRFAGEKDQHIAGRMPAFVLKLPGVAIVQRIRLLRRSRLAE